MLNKKLLPQNSINYYYIRLREEKILLNTEFMC